VDLIILFRGGTSLATDDITTEAWSRIDWTMVSVNILVSVGAANGVRAALAKHTAACKTIGADEVESPAMPDWRAPA